jgi:hypothetical protein
VAEGAVHREDLFDVGWGGRQRIQGLGAKGESSWVVETKAAPATFGATPHPLELISPIKVLVWRT